MVSVHGPFPLQEMCWLKVEGEVEELGFQGEKLENSAERRKLRLKRGERKVGFTYWMSSKTPFL